MSTHNNECLIIKSLPKDMLVYIFGMIASESLEDIGSIMLTCKVFLEALEDTHVYEKLCLDNFSLEQHYWMNPSIIFFLQRCKLSGNKDALYREALFDFFCSPNGNIHPLKTLAEGGHIQSKYVYGMVLLCSPYDNVLNEGLGHMRFVRKSKCIIKCHNSLQRIALQLVWNGRRNHVAMPLVRNETRLCTIQRCDGWKLKGGAWVFLNDEEDDISSCENCRWDAEINFFLRLFNVY